MCEHFKNPHTVETKTGRSRPRNFDLPNVDEEEFCPSSFLKNLPTFTSCLEKEQEVLRNWTAGESETDRFPLSLSDLYLSFSSA